MEGPPGSPEDNSVTLRNWYSRARNHLGLVVAGLLAAFYVVNVMVTSNGSIETARALIAETSPAAVAFGVAAAAALPFCMICLGILPAVVYYTSGSRFWSVLTYVLFFAVGLFIPLVSLAQFTVISLLNFLIAVVTRSISNHRWTLDLRVIGFVVVTTYAILGGSVGIWLPAQTLQTSDGETTTVFVLNESDRDIVVLRNADRAVVRVARDDVDSLTFCADESLWTSRSLAQRWGSVPSPDYPPCVDS